MASIPLPNGATLQLVTALATAKVISGTTNANPAVASSAAHGLSDGAVGLLSIPSWVYADNRIIRVDDTATGTFKLEGLDTSNTSKYPAGGAGSFKALSTKVPVPKVTNFALTGGDVKSGTSSYIDIEQDFEFKIGKNPLRLEFSISYNLGSAHHNALVSADEGSDLSIFELTLKNGAVMYFVGEMSYQEIPTTEKDNEMICSGVMLLQSKPTAYAKFVA